MRSTASNSRAPGDPVGLERRGDSETDRLFRARGVGDDKIGVKRVECALAAFDRGVKALQIDRNIGPLFRFAHLPRFSSNLILPVCPAFFKRCAPGGCPISVPEKDQDEAGDPLRLDLV